MDIYMDLTMAISESGGRLLGKFVACLVESNNLDRADESILSSLTGYGETPLEAAANFLALAYQMRKEREP